MENIIFCAVVPMEFELNGIEFLYFKSTESLLKSYDMSNSPQP